MKIFRDLQDTIKFTNLCIIRVPEGEEKERKGPLKFPFFFVYLLLFPYSVLTLA